LAKKVRDLLSSDRITISTTTDVIGIELVGALKNVLAIAMGIVTGSDMGDNSRAALLTYVRTYLPCGCQEYIGRSLADKRALWQEKES
jgi:hypothetical protein